LNQKPSRTISASEIAAYLYCARSWSYQRQGRESTNTQLMQTGEAVHQAHGQQVLFTSAIRRIAILLFLAAFILLILALLP
jgi:hypothetical protein